MSESNTPSSTAGDDVVESGSASAAQLSAPVPPGLIERFSSLGIIFHLARVSTFAGATARQFRSLRLSGAMLAISGVGSVALVHSLGAGDVVDIVALRILAYSCWLYGGLGLWALLSPPSLDNFGAKLIRMRGQEANLFHSQSLGFAQLLAKGMCLAGLPGIATAALLSSSLELLQQRLALLALSSVYLLSLGGVLGVLGALSYRSAPKNPRRFALTLILLPFLLSFFINDIPSVPGLYSWALAKMIAWGGSVS